MQQLENRTKLGTDDQPGAGGNPATEPQLTDKKAKALKKREARQQQILDGLAQLRTASREVTQSYLSNLESSIDQAASSIRDQDQTAGEKGALKGRTLKQMSAVLDRVSLKTDKGRRKDLKRIEQTVAELIRLLPRKKGK